MNNLTLILGGARSGKSSLAEKLAAASGGRVLFLATATAGDEEMARRILSHRQSRPVSWRTLEEPLHLGDSIAREAGNADVILVDCITLWVSNLQMANEDVPDERLEELALTEARTFIAACRGLDASVIMISNEVGLGLVPPNPLGRRYRDTLGRVNQLLAAAADEVYLMVAGIPMAVKKRCPK